MSRYDQSSSRSCIYTTSLSYNTDKQNRKNILLAAQRNGQLTQGFMISQYLRMDSSETDMSDQIPERSMVDIYSVRNQSWTLSYCPELRMSYFYWIEDVMQSVTEEKGAP